VRVLKGDHAEMLERARIVRNTVEFDPDMPTLAEVRELIDAELEEKEADAPAEAAPVSMQSLN
jgi:hypothetical protein